MKIYNHKAKLQYSILETLEVGIVLTGAEVKSLRAGRADLSESFARVSKGEVVLKNLYIPPFMGSDPRDYNPRSDRKLLLHKNQILYLQGKLSKGGMALVPLSIYDKHNFFKVDLGLGQSKRKFDHRQAIKLRDEQRKIEQELKGF